MAKQSNLVSLTATDYLKLEYGDVVYDGWGQRWVVKAVNFPVKSNPKSRDISLKHGLYANSKLALRNGKPDEKMFKERGTVFAAPKSPKAGLVRGVRVVAKVPLSYGEKSVKAGVKGTIVKIRPLTPAQSKQFHHGEKAFLAVRWDRGSTFQNVYPSQVKRV